MPYFSYALLSAIRPWRATLCIACASLALTGCLPNTLPNCSDKETLQVVDQLVQETLAKSRYGQELKSSTQYAVRRIAQVSHDASNQRYQCQALLEFSNPESNKRRASDIVYEVYAVQDDEGDFMVEIEGLTEAVLGAAMAKSMGAL